MGEARTCDHKIDNQPQNLTHENEKKSALRHDLQRIFIFNSVIWAPGSNLLKEHSLDQVAYNLSVKMMSN